MPQMANITVKKADGTTNVVYTAVTGSAGDKTNAVWQNTSVGTVPAERPTFAMQTMSNGTGTSRRVKMSGSWPTTKQDAGGNKIVNGRARQKV